MALVLWVESRMDFFLERSYLNQLAVTIHRCKSAKRTVRALPVVKNCHSSSCDESSGLVRSTVAKLHLICLLRAFHLAIQVRGTRSVRSKLNARPAQRALERSTEELSSAIGLDSLNAKRKFVQHALFEKVNRILCCASRINAEHSQSSAIVNRGVLINARSNLPRVKLHAFAGNLATEALWLSAATTLQHERVVGRDNTVNFANRSWQIERTKLRGTLAIS